MGIAGHFDEARRRRASVVRRVSRWRRLRTGEEACAAGSAADGANPGCTLWGEILAIAPSGGLTSAGGALAAATGGGHRGKIGPSGRTFPPLAERALLLEMGYHHGDVVIATVLVGPIHHALASFFPLRLGRENVHDLLAQHHFR